MMIMDYSQVCIATYMVIMGKIAKGDVDINLFRHMVLNTIRSLRFKFKNDYGNELIIACDGKNNWRRDVYPYYKAQRRASRQDTDVPWADIFSAIDQIRQEIDEFFPYRVIQVDGTEADDVIGTLIHEKFGRQLNSDDPENRVLILSGDKDFIQLHSYGNVNQWNPALNKWVRPNSPYNDLIDMVIRGDVGDGVPNVLSPDDTFVAEKKQTVLSKKRYGRVYEAIKDIYPQFHLAEDLSSDEVINLQRNFKLIDLQNTPNEIKQAILEKYDVQGGKDRSKIYKYIIANRLSKLMKNMKDF